MEQSTARLNYQNYEVDQSPLLLPNTIQASYPCEGCEITLKCVIVNPSTIAQDSSDFEMHRRIRSRI